VSTTAKFCEVLEAADGLSIDEQEALISILQRPVVQAGRQRLVEDVKESRRAFEAGECCTATPEELMREILS